MLDSSEDVSGAIPDMAPDFVSKAKKNLKFVIYSSVHLERWDSEKPFSSGIGGSETSHIEMVHHLQNRGHEVYSYIPLPSDVEETEFVKNFENFDPKNHPDSIVVVYRDCSFFDKELDKSCVHWFIAQDVQYGFTSEQLSKVDRYFTLCPVHYQFTRHLYPEIADKICVTSNGIRSNFIRHIKARVKNEKIPRDNKRLIYTSSPDRGIILVLRNWFRILEQVPDANLHIYYGWENADKVIAANPHSHLVPLKQEFDRLIQQPGIIHHSRVAQDRLYMAMHQASIFPGLHTFPETSMISLMELQACGVACVANDYWAIKQNLLSGFLYEGMPDSNQMLRIRMIDKIISLLKDPPTAKFRKECSEEALEVFDWKNFAIQWESLGRVDVG